MPLPAPSLLGGGKQSSCPLRTSILGACTRQKAEIIWSPELLAKLFLEFCISTCCHSIDSGHKVLWGPPGTCSLSHRGLWL